MFVNRYRIFAQPPSGNGLKWEVYTRPFSLMLWYFIAAIFVLIIITFAFASWSLKTIESIKKKKKYLDESRKKQDSTNYFLYGNEHVITFVPRNDDETHKISSATHVTVIQKRIASKPIESNEETRLSAWLRESPFLVWSSFMQQGMSINGAF